MRGKDNFRFERHFLSVGLRAPGATGSYGDGDAGHADVQLSVRRHDAAQGAESRRESQFGQANFHHGDPWGRFLAECKSGQRHFARFPQRECESR